MKGLGPHCGSMNFPLAGSIAASARVAAPSFERAKIGVK
jgi:hypothetical protein